MRIGVVNEETWGFFNEIFAELSVHHQVSIFHSGLRKLPIFESRINNILTRRDWLNFVSGQDLIFCEWASESLVYLTHLPKTTKIVTRLHRYELYNWVEKVNWAAVDKIIFVSEAKRKEFAQLYPATVDRQIVIPVGIDFDKFLQKPREFQGNIGILCHLTPRKRIYELILAFSVLARQTQDYHLHIAGGKHPRFGDYYQALYQLVRRLGISSRVTFYGNVDNPKEWYSGIEIFVSNSYSEGLQVAPMEAVAGGCYCLAHHWDGADELLPINNLFLTEHELIERVDQFSKMSGTEQVKRITDLQSNIQEQFNIHKLKKQIRQLIEDVAVAPDRNRWGQ